MRSRLQRWLACIFLLTSIPLLIGQSHRHLQARPPEFTFKIVRTFPHDPAAFTQGLAYRDGFLYEGTGLNGHSSLRKVRLESGEVVQKVDLAPEFFGEGIALLKMKPYSSHGNHTPVLFTTLVTFACCDVSLIPAKAGG